MLRALHLITKNNIFLFSDSYWLQLKETVMGKPPATIYGTFFYGVFKLFLLERFGNNLLLYRRFIDYVMVLCKKYDEEHDAEYLRAFQEIVQ